MLVDFLERGLVDVRVLVGLAVVAVLVLVLDVLMVMTGMCVNVVLAVVLVLVCVWSFVGVLVAHACSLVDSCWTVVWIWGPPRPPTRR